MVKGVWAARALFSPTIELPSTQAYSWAMKTAILGTLLLMVLTSTAQDSKPAADVRVPDVATALGIAESALIKAYGKRQIASAVGHVREKRNAQWAI
jgi:hypothetical protein